MPDELSVIGFDDLDMSALLTPPLTTIRQDIKKKAEIACGLLMKKIKEPETPAENIVLNVELAVRGSVKNLLDEEKH